MIIRDKEIRKLGFNPGVAANHRLTIDLDDDDDDENTSNEPHDEPDPCNEASLVEGLIPSLANLKITPIERERAQGSRAVGLIHSKGVSKAIKLILHSDIPFGSPALAREVEGTKMINTNDSATSSYLTILQPKKYPRIALVLLHRKNQPLKSHSPM